MRVGGLGRAMVLSYTFGLGVLPVRSTVFFLPLAAFFCGTSIGVGNALAPATAMAAEKVEKPFVVDGRALNA